LIQDITTTSWRATLNTKFASTFLHLSYRTVSKSSLADSYNIIHGDPLKRCYLKQNYFYLLDGIVILSDKKNDLRHSVSQKL